ncbi:hypothetical protein ABIB25_005198 [Nakamurella sp. UYEF19]|uniref:hypothetical protein n=1 Tax=Nakamurella sp. UYEF19 TaxID=1756392 RepID=UPI0033977E95
MAVGCTQEVVGGSGRPDSSFAFAIFSRPERTTDHIPAPLWNEPSPSTSGEAPTVRLAVNGDQRQIYVVHTSDDQICVVADGNPGVDTIGGQGCAPGTVATLRLLTFGVHEGVAANDWTAVLIPDGGTVTINRGTFVAAGGGVLIVRGNGIAVTVTGTNGGPLQLTIAGR